MRFAMESRQTDEEVFAGAGASGDVPSSAAGAGAGSGPEAVADDGAVGGGTGDGAGSYFTCEAAGGSLVEDGSEVLNMPTCE